MQKIILRPRKEIGKNDNCNNVAKINFVVTSKRYRFTVLKINDMTIIYQFIRANENGTFERITWSKSNSGSKQVSKELTNPGPDQVKQILLSKYQEVVL